MGMLQIQRPRTRLRCSLVAFALACLLSCIGAGGTAEQEEDVRPSALAGQWYPATEAELLEQVRAMLGDARATNLYGELRALILPHAGYAYSGRAAATGVASIGGQSFSRVIILAPSHSYPLSGCSVPSFSAYETPLGRIPLDREACSALRRLSVIDDNRRAHTGEHSIEIQLPLLQEKIGKFSLVPVLVGRLSMDQVREVAEALAPLLDADTLLIASSDFTHYGDRFAYKPFTENVSENIRELDYGAFAEIMNCDAAGLLEYRQRTGITACGAVPIAILLEALGQQTQPLLLTYYRSGDLSGQWDSSVSYGAFCFTTRRVELNEEEQSTLLRLSRDLLTSYLSSGGNPNLDIHSYNITPAMMRPAGVFVTLKKSGELRGCIGTIQAVSPICHAVADNTIKAALSDPRFAPVAAEEVGALTIEISVLSPLERLRSAEQITVGADGLLLVKGDHSGLLLPQVATEHNLDCEQFLHHLCIKAGLPPGAHNDPEAQLYRFQVQKFAEE